VAQREQEDDVFRFDNVVEGNVAALASGYHQLSQAVFGGPTDRRMAFKNLQCVENQGDCGVGGDQIIASEKLEYPVEIGLGARRKL
jgi:hypothetical protein